MITDKYSNAEVNIGYEHHRIHSGNHFYIVGFSTVNSDASLYFGVRTLNSSNEAHMDFYIEAISQVEFYIFEDAAFTNGSSVTPLNNNRGNNTTSDLVVRLNPTVAGGATGTSIYEQSSGFAAATVQQGKAGFHTRDREIILKSDTDYIFQIKSKDDDNIISYIGEWYELVE